MIRLQSVLLACVLMAPLTAGAKPVHIGVSLPSAQRQTRWAKDAEQLRKAAQAEGVKLSMQISDDGTARQAAQCEKLLAAGIDLLILTPLDADSAAAIVETAHKAGVKVISYDRLVLDADVDLYVSFDNVQVGRLQGEFLTRLAPKGRYVVLGGALTDNNSRLFKQGALEVIQPLEDQGAIQIAMDQWVTDWQPLVAKMQTQNALAAYGNKIDAVLAPNDDTAGGVIQALAEAGLAGKIPVTGQDADPAAAKRIAQGLQSMTVFKDTRLLAAAAVRAAVKMVKGEAPGATSQVNNRKIDVPAILLVPVAVDKNNLDAVLIQSGYLKRREVYD